MLRLYDTLTKTVKPVNTTTNNYVKIYTCGPTVYRESHLGNLRSYLMADWIKRILINNGSKILKKNSISSYQLDSELILSKVLNESREKILTFLSFANLRFPPDFTSIFYLPNDQENDKK